MNLNYNLPISTECVVISLTLSKYSIQRKADKEKISSTISKELATFGKKIIISPELNAITNFDKQICDYLSWQNGRRTLPCSFLKDGVYLVPEELWPEVHTKLNSFKVQREILVEQFSSMFSTRILETVSGLGDEFNWSDYPEYDYPSGMVNQDKLRNKFKMEWFVSRLTVPASLQQFNKSLFDEHLRETQQTFLLAQQEIITLMRQETIIFIKGMIERLAPNSDGTKKKLHESYFDKMRDFCEVFEKRNIANDEDLAVAIKHCKSLLDKNDPENLDTQSLRDQLSQQFQHALEAFDAIKDSKFSALDSAFDFDDDEDEKVLVFQSICAA